MVFNLAQYSEIERLPSSKPWSSSYNSMGRTSLLSLYSASMACQTRRAMALGLNMSWKILGEMVA